MKTKIDVDIIKAIILVVVILLILSLVFPLAAGAQLSFPTTGVGVEKHANVPTSKWTYVYET